MAKSRQQIPAGGRTSPAIDRKDWDFSPCREEEMMACHAYEFARECPITVESVRLFHASRPRRTFECLWEDIHEPHLVLMPLSNGRSLPGGLFTACPEFPSPYLSIIPNAERLKRARIEQNSILWADGLLQTDIKHIESQGPAYSFNWNEDCESGTFNYEAFETVAFDIDWSKEDTLIIRRFAQWLKEHGPVRRKHIEVQTGRGKGSLVAQRRADLKSLGALRLLRRMNWQAARDHTFAVLGKPLFGRQSGDQSVFDQSAWIDAPKRAERILAGLAAKEND